MLELIAKRLVLFTATLLAASLLFFMVTEFQRGDFAAARAGRFATPDMLENIRESHGLYRPAYIRYLDWLSHLMDGELGYSWSNGRKITGLIAKRLRNSFFLATVTALVAIPFALTIGFVTVIKRNTSIDRIISIGAITAISIPEYVIAYVLVLVLAVKLPLFPLIAASLNYQNIWGQLYTIVLPVLTLALAMMPSIVRIARAAVINILSRPFIEMADLKGLRPSRIFFHHALPHAIGPIFNVVILGVAHLLVGIVIVEYVFAYPGIGQLMIDAVRMRDMPVIQACGLIFTSIYMVLILLADIIVVMSNPLHFLKPSPKPKRRFLRSAAWSKVNWRYAFILITVIILIGAYAGLRNFLHTFRLEQAEKISTGAVAPMYTRNHLTAEELLQGLKPDPNLVHNSFYMPGIDSSPALHELAGILTVAKAKISGQRIGIRTSGQLGFFPALKLPFFMVGEHFVPVNRDMILSGGGSWDIVLAAGRIWSEPGDKGYSRASFPFTLVGSKWSQTHNGLATFIFNAKHVSNLRFQIVQESAPMEQFDGWGQTTMAYSSRKFSNLSALRQQFADELKLLTPIRSWNQLEADYDPHMLDRIDATTNRKNITLSGLIIDDRVYARDCRTRWGEYPYCDNMRHGIYSVSKSLGALIAMLRLAQKYGIEIFDYKITDYIEINSNHAGLEKLTFGDALNMATGIGNIEPRRVSSYVEANSTPLATKIFNSQSTGEKLNLMAKFANYPWNPGEVFRYRSSDTMLLTIAMDRLVKEREGASTDLWGLIIREVLKPIGITRMPMLLTREPKGAKGVPLFDSGMIPTLDEIAKLVKLLRNGGRFREHQILRVEKLDEILGKSPRPGLPTGWQIQNGETNYHMSFWLHPYRTKGGNLIRIPAMSGHGGNYIILLPNGITAFRFADGRNNSPGTWDSSGLREVAEYIRPFEPR